MYDNHYICHVDNYLKTCGYKYINSTCKYMFKYLFLHEILKNDGN